MPNNAMKPFSRKHSVEPAQLSSLMSDMLASLGKKDPKAMRAAQANAVWSAVAPQQILEHTENVYLLNTDGCKEMVVLVDDSAWAADLTAQQEQFRYAVEKQLGEGPLDRIRFKASAASYKRNTRRKKTKEKLVETPSYIEDVDLVPVTDEQRKKIEEECSCIDDEAVREALIKARVASLALENGREASKTKDGRRRTDA